MRTTDILREEHRWILSLLLCLERVIEDSERRGHLDPRPAAELLALFTHFADGLHQEREERCLFPRLLARARSVAEQMDIGRLVGEHEQERGAMARLAQDLLGAIYGRSHSLQDFQDEARRYIRAQRAHLAHENRELLPLAEVLLTGEDDRVIEAWFRELEGSGPWRAQEIYARIERLCVHLAIDPRTEPQGRRSSSEF